MTAMTLPAALQRIAELESKLADIDKDRDYLNKAGLANEWEDRYQIQQDKIAELEAKFTDHTKAVGVFLGEMYATMIDPLDEGERKVAETCQALLEAARSQRDEMHALQGNQCHLDAIAQALGQPKENNSGFVRCATCGHWHGGVGTEPGNPCTHFLTSLGAECGCTESATQQSKKYLPDQGSVTNETVV